MITKTDTVDLTMLLLRDTFLPRNGSFQKEFITFEEVVFMVEEKIEGFAQRAEGLQPESDGYKILASLAYEFDELRKEINEKRSR